MSEFHFLWLKTLLFWQIGTTNVMMHVNVFTLPSPFKTFSGRGGGSYYSNSGGGGSSRSSGLRGSYWWCHPTLPIHPDVCSPLSIGHIYRISVCKLESWSEVSHVLCQSSSHGRLVPKTSPQKAEQDHMWPQRALWTTPVLKVSKGQMLDFFKVLNVVLEVFLDLILSKQFAIVI